MLANILGPFVTKFNIFDYDRPVHPALRKRLRTHKFFFQKEQRFTFIILSALLKLIKTSSNIFVCLFFI